MSKFCFKISPGARENFPWLYYRLPTLEVLERKDILNFDISIDYRDPLKFYKLEFILFVYSIDGKFVRSEPLTDKLSLCSRTYQDGHSYREIQTSYINECDINIKDFLKKQNNTMEFYEIFVKDFSQQNQMVDVPILIKNVKNTQFPNKLNNETGTENAILTRRFFILDNVSGIQGDRNYANYLKNFYSKQREFENILNDKNRVLPIAIRYASEIKLIINVRTDVKYRIFRPYVEIFYKSKLVSTSQTYFLSRISFLVDQKMNITRFNNIMLGLLIAFIIVILIVSGIRLNVWRTTHPKYYEPVSLILT